MAFSVYAFALSTDMTGVVYYRGWYIDNPTLQDESAPTAFTPSIGNTAPPATRVGAISTAHVDQRLRVFTRLKVADGLDFVMRMDWMEDKWRPAPNAVAAGSPDSIGTEPTVVLDHGYVNFRTVAGTFRVGWQGGPSSFGTDFMNSGGARPAIVWFKNFGALRVGAVWQKQQENAFYENPWAVAQTDADSDIYALRANYDRKKGLDVGAQVVFARDATGRIPETAAGASTGSALLAMYAFEPYVRAKLGPVDLEAEGFWAFGDYAKQDLPTPAAPDVTAEGRGLYVDAKVNMGPAYVGATYIFMSGDDPTTADVREGNMASNFGGGTSLRGDRMFFSGSDYYTKQVGTYRVPTVGGTAGRLQGAGGGTNSITNLKSYGLRGGFSPSKKLSTEASVWLMKVDKTPLTTFISDDIGKEFAATANYKLYDNLAVQVDFAYLWTGDYFKGATPAALIANNYFVTSWLILDF